GDRVRDDVGLHARDVPDVLVADPDDQTGVLLVEVQVVGGAAGRGDLDVVDLEHPVVVGVAVDLLPGDQREEQPVARRGREVQVDLLPDGDRAVGLRVRLDHVAGDLAVALVVVGACGAGGQHRGRHDERHHQRQQEGQGTTSSHALQASGATTSAPHPPGGETSPSRRN